MLGRRQLDEQRQFLSEQNERARLTLTVDLLFRYAGRFESQFFLDRRRAAARYLLDNASVDDGISEVQELNRAGWDVCGFFEDLGHLHRVEALPPETVWNSFGTAIRTYWPLCKPAIEKLREEWGAPALYEEFEYLSGVLAYIERERGIESPANETLRQVLENEVESDKGEALSGEEPTTKAV